MPVFLLPIMVGGYYYLKNKKDEIQGNVTGDSEDTAQTPSSSADAAAASEEEDCQSIEVRLLVDSARRQQQQQQQHDDDDEPQQPQQPSRQRLTTTAAAASSASLKEAMSRVRTRVQTVLTRKESSDTRSQQQLTTAASSSRSNEATACCVRTQVLTRKESADTVQSELSLSGELDDDDDMPQPVTRELVDEQQQPAIPVEHPSYGLGMLSSHCGDCDQEGLFEIVDCGHSHDLGDNPSQVAVWA